MPFAAHQAVPDWIGDEFRAESIFKGFFTCDELRNFALYGSRRYDRFPPPWDNTYKEPDAAIAFRGVQVPIIAVEVGYSESWSRLIDDKLVWILGGAPHVNAVLLVNGI
ncbi:hypothetical protein BDV40DRAFT_258008 [Aspergillus tamarii]|uniref:Uncharacterized protein n=1 Tax=Aspergillus tamarii TaxID=41984 RepID=A0A5N6V475_ASPTM|nr:hypothetical protein BDV40DRAFT_258008 [Aspergillus tamarii]